MERPGEIVRDVWDHAGNIGKFVAERLFTPGGWSDVAPKPANIQVHSTDLEEYGADQFNRGVN